ncbi:MAG: translocation/assembly module TamB domain-containing protein [Thiogranum sp.]
MRILFRTLLITFLFIAVLLVYVSTTQHGLKLLWQTLQPLLPAGLSVEHLEGRLTGPLTVTGLTFRNEGFKLVLDRGELEWAPAQLLTGVLQVDRLALEDIRYTPGGKAAPVTATAPLVLPERIALPIGVKLEQFRVANFTVETADGAAALVIEQGDVSLSYQDAALEIRDLSVLSTDFQIAGSARLRTAADYPVQAVLDWRISPPDYAAVQGQTTVSGTLKRLRVTQTFNETYPVTGKLLITGLPDMPNLEASVNVDGLTLAEVNDDLPAMQLTAEFRAGGRVDTLTLSGWLDIDAETLPTLRADIETQLSAEGLEVEKLHLTAPDLQTELRVSGPVDFEADGIGFDLHADWNQLRWPLAGAAQMESPTGRLHLRGSPDDYRFDSQMRLAAPGYTDADLSLQGSGSQDALQIAELNIDTLNGYLQGTATVAWRPGLETSIEINGSSLNPGVIIPEWAGQLDMQLTAQADFTSTGIVAQVPRFSIKGQLRDLPIELDAQGGYQQNALTLEKFSLVSGPSALNLGGSIGTSLNIDWRLDSPDLDSLLPTASGRLVCEGRVGGTFATPLVKVKLSGSDLRYGNDRLSKIDLDAIVDMTAAIESNLALKLGKGFIQGTTINSLDLQATGVPTQHSVTLSVDSNLVKGQLEAKGNWKDNVWHFDLQEAELGHPEFAPWSLANSFQGQLGQDRIAANRSCWHSGEARLCLRGAFTAGTGNGEISLRELPLGYFAGLLPAGVEAQGALELDAEIKQQAGLPATTHLQLNSKALALVFAAEGQRPDVRIEASEASLNLAGDPQSTRLAGALSLNNDAKLSMNATVSGSDADFLNRALSGNTSIEIPDIAFLGELTPHISDIQGALNGWVRFSGSLRAPGLEGRVHSTDTRLLLDQPGITLEGVELTLQGQPDGDIMLDLAAQSGEGQLTIKGESNLKTTPRSARLSITGSDFRVMDTREAVISASPDLTLALTGQQIDIDGQITVPSARIRPRKLPESSVSVSADQIIVDDDEATAAESAYQVTSRVRFILGEQVKFDGFGLKGRISGNLLAKDQPGKPTTASGELAINDGQYRAYGQNLDIRTGRLLFAGGPVSAPGLDIEAVRRPAPDILVGVRARGSLRKPDFSLFSEPTMSQSDQLSWLVLGRPLESKGSAQDRNSMNQAAIMLGLGGGLALTEEYGEKLGIDEISIESDPDDTTNQASLLVGKYLSPKLFVSYGVGIFEPVSTLRLIYTLGSQWRLVGESSALRSGADLFYVIEFGE